MNNANEVSFDLTPLYHTKAKKHDSDDIFIDEFYGFLCVRESNNIIVVLRAYNLVQGKTEHITCQFDGPIADDLRRIVEETDEETVEIKFGETKHNAYIERCDAEPDDWCKWDVTIDREELLPISAEAWKQKCEDIEKLGMVHKVKYLSDEFMRWSRIYKVALFNEGKEKHKDYVNPKEAERAKQELESAEDKDYILWADYEKDESNINKLQQTVSGALDLLAEFIREIEENAKH